MERHEQSDELVDLGAVSVETLGQPGTKLEAGVVGRPIGLSDDD